jgi:hypothetical protein
MLPILIPLSILAAGCVTELPPSLERNWFRSNLALLVLAATLGWALWALMIWRGHPPALPVVSGYLSSDYVPHVDRLAVTAAVALTVGGLLLMRALRDRSGRAVLSSAIAVTLCWGLLCTLALPWVDHAKSYRGVFQTLSAALPAEVDCVSSEGVGEHSRTLLHYVSGLTTLRKELIPDSPCSYLLIQRDRALDSSDPSARGSVVWVGRRPAEQREEFLLVRTRQPSALAQRVGNTAREGLRPHAGLAHGPAGLSL